jgi:DNA polymerase-3 subunit delta
VGATLARSGAGRLPVLSFGTMADAAALLPAYLILGTDRPKVRLAVARLRKRVVDEAGSDLNVVLLDAEQDKVEELLDAAASPGLTFGTRLLLVLNGHKWNAKARQQVAAYLQDPMPETCLAVEAEAIPATDALHKAVKKLGGILEWNLPKKYEMAGWVSRQAKSHGLHMSAQVARHLLDRCGSDPGHAERLDREIEKLAIYCRGEATEADVDAVCTPDDDAVIFDLMDAVGARDRAHSFRLLEALYASGNPRNDANGVLYSLKRHVEQLDAASQLPHADQSTAARQLKVHPFTAKKLLQQREHFDRRRLGRAYRALAEAEAGLRGRAPVTLDSVGGVNDADRLVVELALARMLA